MTGKNLHYWSATRIASEIRDGNLSPVEVVEAHYDRIRARNSEINAFINLLEERAISAAEDAEDAVNADEELGPLHGVPVGVKDLLGRIEGVPHTQGAKPLGNIIADEDSVAVQRLKEAGAIILGTTNTPEFGHKGLTDNKLIGATPNPYDLDRTSGGSSGGSTAAVAEGMVPIATGSDAAGSCRIPASACNVFGYCPSFTRIPDSHRDNLFVAPPFFQMGTIARTVSDAALMLDVLSGPHISDPFALPDDGSTYLDATEDSIEGLDIAYTPDFDGLFPVEEEVQAVVEDALEVFEQAGATVEEIEIGVTHSYDVLNEPFLTHWGITMASINEGVAEKHGIDMYGDHREDLPSEVINKIEQGRETSGLDLQRAQAVITEFYRVVQRIWSQYDLIASPTLATLPPKIDSGLGPNEIAGEDIHDEMGWFLTWPFNYTATPNASLPAGFSSGGLPIGLQLVGPRYEDERVLAASSRYEELNPWFDGYPPS